VEAPLEDGYLVDPVAAGHPRYVPHRILASTHRRETGTVWVEDGLRSTLHRASSAVAASEAEALRESFVEVGGWEDVHRRYQARRRLVRAVLEDARHDPALVVVAAEGLLEALAEAPAEPLLLNELGVLLYGLGEWAAAEKIFVAVSRLDPELPGVGDNILSTREARRAGGAAVRVVRSSRSRAVASRAEGIARRARPAEGMRISLCMIVKDEEEMLPGCLGAIAPAVDEMIVVDTGSTDRTVAIAESFGAKVVSFPWNGSFADARNVSLDHATGDWILWLDADEHLVEGDAPRLRALARKTWREGIYITLNNRLGEADEEGFVHLTMRLFRNRPEYRFAGRIHEQHTDAMPLHLPERFEASDVRVDHWGYRAERVAERNKNERNRSLLEREAAESRRIDPFTDFNLGTEHLIAGEPEQAVPLLQRSWRAVVAASGPRPQYMPSLATRLLQAYRLAGEPRAALAVGEEILPIYADHTDVVRELALSARATGDLEQAAAWSERCLELGDAPARYAGAIGAGTFLALGLLASVRAEQGKLDEAEQLLERSLREHPGYRQAERALADVRGLRGAERLYERAVQGDGAGLRSSLAEAVLPAAEQSAYSAWLDVLEGRPAELPVESTPAVAALLDRLLREQRFDAFESLAAVWSSSHLPERERRGFLADLYLAHGFLDSALEEWLALADDEAGDPRALLGLARIALARGLRGDAEALASEALRLDPTLAAARELMAAALEQEESVAHAG
jgi:tetratricopeptide (TPR) repeat protein